MKLAVSGLLIAGLLISVTPAFARAQSFVIDVPLASQRAQISQTIGLTDITITYHRPRVNGRPIWGALVPYDSVWRVGANMNTTISFTDPVSINGHPLDRGTYGLHMIPHRDTWTVIFSKNSTSWGSFTYDSTEDALRIPVKPIPAPMHEALTFDFDQLQPTTTVVDMQWEKLAIPFTVAVDVHTVALASLHRQLRTLVRYTWMSWDEAANYLLAEHLDLDTALVFVDRSIKTEDRYDNELTRAKILLALGRPRQDALMAFRDGAKKHPDDPRWRDALAKMEKEGQ
jgi:hypothetical protein